MLCATRMSSGFLILMPEIGKFLSFKLCKGTRHAQDINNHVLEQESYILIS